MEEEDANSVEISEEISIASELIQALHSSDLNDVLNAVKEFQELLNDGYVPSTDELVEKRIALRLAEFEYISTNEELRSKSATISNTLASGSTQHRILINEISIPFLIQSVVYGLKEVQEESMLILGCLADENLHYREFILDQGILNALLPLVMSSNELSVVINATRLLYYLCQGLYGYPDYKKVAPVYPIMSSLLTHYDHQILIYACETLSSLASGSIETRGSRVSEEPFDKLIKLLSDQSLELVEAAVNALSVITKSKNRRRHLLKYMPMLLTSSKGSICNTVCKIIISMTASTPEDKRHQLEDVADTDIYAVIIAIINKRHPETLEDTTNALFTAVKYGRSTHVTYLVSVGCIPCLCNLVRGLNNTDIVEKSLECLHKVFSIGRCITKALGQTRNYFADHVIQCKGECSLKELRCHPDEVVRLKADYIVKKYTSKFI